MGQDIGARTRGYAWFVSPDSAAAGASTRDEPFDSTHPPGVLDFWTLGDQASGVQNVGLGRSYLVVTEALKPPEVSPGWTAEPARLDEGFAIEQRGGRWVRLVRVLARRETDRGHVAECEFEVDRT